MTIYEWGVALEPHVAPAQLPYVKQIVFQTIANSRDFVEEKATQLNLPPETTVQLKAAACQPEEGGGGTVNG